MPKIANTHELANELRRLLAYAGTRYPSRVKLANELSDLRMRVAMGGMFKKLKIKDVEFVREDTYKITASSGKDELRITLYPGGRMLVLGGRSETVDYLQGDLSEQAQKQVIKAVKDFKAREATPR